MENSTYTEMPIKSNPVARVVSTEMAQLKRDEGFRSRPYVDDEGYLTVGYGTCIAHIGDAPFEPIMEINEKQGEALLRTEAMEIGREMFDTWAWLEDKPLAIQCVMLNMAYNLGVPRLAKFTQTLAAIAADDYEKASRVMLLNSAGDDKSPWYEQVGKRAERLSARLAYCRRP